MAHYTWLTPHTPSHCQCNGVACGGLKPDSVNELKRAAETADVRASRFNLLHRVFQTT